MAGFFSHSSSPAGIDSVIQTVLRSRRHGRHMLDEIFRHWPEIPAPGREALRGVFWRRGITPGLLQDFAHSLGKRRETCFDRLIILSDPHVLAPLLALWPRLQTGERAALLAHAGRLNPPGLARLLWRTVAVHAADPPSEMAGLAPLVGPPLTASLGEALNDAENSAWALETLTRLNSCQARELLLSCLGRNDLVGEYAKNHFAALPGQSALTALMETARFHPRWEVRFGAVTVLLKRPEPRALCFLMEILRDWDWYKDAHHRRFAPMPVHASESLHAAGCLPGRT